MKILCTGDRNWNNRRMIEIVLGAVRDTHDPSEVTVIHGNARGADKLCGEVATLLGYKVISRPADWIRYGKSAGPIRNREMLKLNPDIVFAFHNRLTESKGTKDMVSIALDAGIKVILVTLIQAREIKILED
jgi:hypothetical protein